MSLLATMFAKLLNSECFVSLSKRFFDDFAASRNSKSEPFQIEQPSKDFSVAWALIRNNTL